MSETETTAPVAADLLRSAAEEPAVVPAVTETPHSPPEPTPEPPKEAEPAPPEKPKEPPWFTKRIDVLTAKLAAERTLAESAQAERDRFRQELEAIRQGGAQPPTPPPQAMPEMDVEARAAAIVAQREYASAVNRTIETGNKEYTPPAFTAACNTLAQIGANERPDFMRTITDLDHGAKVLHYLGTTPEEAVRVLQLSPTKMAVELARIETRITAPPPPRAVSKAPAPIAPIDGGGSTGEPDIFDPGISYAKYVELRNKQEAARKGGR